MNYLQLYLEKTARFTKKQPFVRRGGTRATFWLDDPEMGYGKTVRPVKKPKGAVAIKAGVPKAREAKLFKGSEFQKYIFEKLASKLQAKGLRHDSSVRSRKIKLISKKPDLIDQLIGRLGKKQENIK